MLNPLFMSPLAAAGQDEVEEAVRLLEEEARKLRRSNLKLRMHPAPLYAGLPAAHQLGVFQPAPREYRKVGLPLPCFPDNWGHC